MKKIKMLFLLILILMPLINIGARLNQKEYNKLKKTIRYAAILGAVAATIKCYQSWDQIKKVIDDPKTNPKEKIKGFVENNKQILKFAGTAGIFAFFASKFKTNQEQDE